MLTKGQKIYMYFSAILAMIIGIITFVPFRTLPFISTSNNIDSVISAELIIKLVVLPLVTIAISVFANVKKYQEIEDCLDRSKVVNVMSYYPIVSYISALLVFIIHTLSYSYEPLGFSVWSVVIVLLVIYLVFTIIAFHLLSNFILRLNLVGTVIFDCVLFVITLCFILVAWRVDKTYLELFGAEADFIGNGDILLFFLYVFALITIIILCSRIYKLIKKDNRSIYYNPLMFENEYDKLVKAEYNRAYNDIMDDFELYFDEHFDDEWVGEEISGTSEQKVEEEIPEEETSEEDENALETSKEPEQEVKEPEEEVNEVEKEKTEEVKVEEKVIEPAYDELKAFALSLGENITEIPNNKNTGHRLLVGNRLFLIMQKTTNDYRLTFASKGEYALNLFHKFPGAIVKPHSPKGDNWFRIINKGDLSLELLQEVIRNSYAFATFEPKKDSHKLIKPSYREVVEMATSVSENVKVITNANGTQHKFFVNNKLYLITQRNYHDYRVIFLAPQEDAMELINEHPGVIVKPTNPQGENWFKLINRDEVDKEFLNGLIVKSLATLNELEESKKVVNEEEVKKETSSLK